MHVILEVIAGPHTAKRIAIPSHLKGTVGRTEWADHPFPDDPLMSSQHFSIEYVGNAWIVRDMGSTNGTYVDEQRVVETTVVSGSIIRAGQTKVKVILEDGLTPRRPPPAREPAAPRPPVVATELDKRSQPAEAPVAPRPASRIDVGSAPKTYQAALGSDDPLLRNSALLAAAWCGRRWVLEHCRGLCAQARQENWDALLLLAILGEPADLEQILAIGRAAELGPRRFQILAAYGHPQVVNDLIVAIESPNAEISVPAGKAFTKITGIGITRDSTGNASTAGSPAENSSAEDAIALPSAQAAARHWRALRDKYSSGRRWLSGLEVSGGLSPRVADTLDLESRFEVCLRARFQGAWQTTRFDREQLADRMASNATGELG